MTSDNRFYKLNYTYIRVHLKTRILKKFTQMFWPIFHGRPLCYVNTYENVQVNRNISRWSTQQSDNHIFQKHDLFILIIHYYFHASTWIPVTKRGQTFTQIHYQKYYTNLISFYKIFFSDLAPHLVPFNSLNNILIILLNLTEDRKSELIRTLRCARSWVQFYDRIFYCAAS